MSSERDRRKRQEQQAESIITVHGLAFAIATFNVAHGVRNNDLSEARAMLKTRIADALSDEFERGRKAGAGR